jgi:hypothetical protein
MVDHALLREPDGRRPLLELEFPCPACGYDCRAQVAGGMLRCPECGGAIPDVRGHANPLIAWQAANALERWKEK